MDYEKELYIDFDIGLSEEHLREKERRFVSMERQKHHKQHLLYELSHRTIYKPSIWRESKWSDEYGGFVDTNRVKRNKESKTQKQLKKASCRAVRHLPTEALPPKGNHYRKIFDYWWN